MRRVSPAVAVLDTLDRALLQPFLRSCPCRHLAALTATGYGAAATGVVFAAGLVSDHWVPFWLAILLMLATIGGLYWLSSVAMAAALRLHVRRVHVMGQTCTWRLSRG
jgi:hypothetical protein